jgi:hypothetical protein
LSSNFAELEVDKPKPVSDVHANVGHTFNNINLTDETPNEDLAVMSAANAVTFYTHGVRVSDTVN